MPQPLNPWNKYDVGGDSFLIIDSREIKERELAKIIDEYKHELSSKAKQDLSNDLVDEAIEFCKKAIGLDSNHVESYYIIGYAYKTKMDYDNAIEYYKKALELDLNHAGAWNGMGLAQASKKNYDNAIESYKTAIGIDSKHSHACYNMGNALLGKKEYDNAVDTLLSIRGSQAIELLKKSILLKG